MLVKTKALPAISRVGISLRPRSELTRWKPHQVQPRLVICERRPAVVPGRILL